MISNGRKYLRFAFICVFTLLVNAALFSLLNTLIEFRTPQINTDNTNTPIVRTYKIATKNQTNPKNQHQPNEEKSPATSPIIPVKPEAVTEIAKHTPQKKRKIQPKLSQKPLLKPVITKTTKTKQIKTQIPKDQTIQPSRDIAFTTEIANNQKVQSDKIENTQQISGSAQQLPPNDLSTSVFDANNLKKIYAPYPQYPRKAKRRNIQGWILTEFKIKKDGSVDQIKVVDGKNTTFFKNEVIKTLTLWRFAKQYPHDIQASMRFVFTLRG